MRANYTVGIRLMNGDTLYVRLDAESARDAQSRAQKDHDGVVFEVLKTEGDVQ
jgi:hypothetical protein